MSETDLGDCERVKYVNNGTGKSGNLHQANTKSRTIDPLSVLGDIFHKEA